MACAVDAQSFPVDSPQWQLEGKARRAEFQGKQCLWLQGGSATLKNFEMQDATLDMDIASPGARGFYGIFFRLIDGGNNSEYVYLRPHKTGLDDAQQYTPVFKSGAAWQLYNGPGFTAAVDIPKDAWFHVRLVVAGAQAKLFVGDMTKPSLEMNDLKTGIRKGGVALAGPAYFANVEIHETPPLPWFATSRLCSAASSKSGACRKA